MPGIKYTGNDKIANQNMQQIWLLLDSEKDSKQRQNLKKRVLFPPYQPPSASTVLTTSCGFSC